MSAEDQELRGDATGKRPLPDGLYQYVLGVSGRPQFLLTFLSVAVFGLSFAPLELQRRIVDIAIKDAVFDSLLMLCALYLAVVLVQGGLKYLMNISRGRISENAMRNIRLRLRGQIEDASNGAEDAGKTVSLVSAEVEPLGGFIGESISSPLVEAGTLFTVLLYPTLIEPIMAIVAVLLFLPQFFFVPPMQAAINARAKDRIETLRNVGDVIVGSTDNTGNEAKKDSRQFAELVDRLFKQRMPIFHMKFAMKFLINLLNHLASIGILFVGGWMAIEGRTEVGTIVAFLSGVQRISEPGRMLVGFFRQLTDARVRYQLIRDYFADGDSPQKP